MVESTGCTLGGQPVVIPDPADPRHRYGIERGANSYTCPIGREPGRGAVLMEREDLEELDLDSALDLKWTGSVVTAAKVKEGGTFTITGLYVAADPIRLDTSGDENPHSLYLVELSDVRWILSRFTSINKAYNLRKPGNVFGATTGDIPERYYEDTLDAGAILDWEGIATDIWDNHLPAALAGAFDALPYTPTGTPEDFRFFGMSAWQALGDVLDQIGCAPQLDPTAGTFSIARMGETQSGLNALITKYVDAKFGLHNTEPMAAKATRVPETIRVHFVFRDERTPFNWILPPYTVDIATNVDGAIADTVLNLWSQCPSRYDFGSGQQEAAELDTIADEIAQNWLATYDVDRQRNVFNGIVTDILPGSEVKAVEWRHDGERWMTVVSRKPGMGVWSETPPKPTERLHSTDLWIRYELFEDLSPGGSAEVEVTYFSGGTYTASVRVEVYDAIGDKSGAIGDPGYARWMPESQRYEIVQQYCL